jgi:hypothetical protein
VLFAGCWALESVAIAFQLLFFMFCLFVLGEPWRLILRKFFGLFTSLDFLQILVVNVYLGGFLLYVIAIVPLHLFSAITLYAITILSSIAVLTVHWRKIRRAIGKLSSHVSFSFPSRHSIETITVASMFLLSLFIQTSPFNYLLFGSVRDTAIHSLFAQVLIENNQIPETEQPYSGAGIVYPQGHSAIIAFSTFILNCSPPQAVFYLTALFNALVILGAYFLGKALSGKRYVGVSLAFVFAFVASWPKYITWGSNALVIGFPFFFVCLGFLVSLAKDKFKIKEIFAIGVLFGYLSVLHLELYQALIVSQFVLWLYVLLKKGKDKWSGLQNLVVVFGVSLLVLSPFLYRAVAFYSYPHHNIGLPADVDIPSVQPSLSLVFNDAIWIFNNLASNPALGIFSLLLFAASLLVIIRIRRKNSLIQDGRLSMIGTATFLGQLLILGLAGIFLSIPLFYPQQLLLIVPFYFFVAAFNILLYRFFYSRLSRKILAKVNGSQLKTRKLLVTTISIMLILGLYAPFLYQTIVLDAWGLYGSYAVFAVTTRQDLQLILWIKDNLSKSATILVNTFQSGTFIPSIANRKVVFLSHALSNSVSYQELVALIEGNSLNVTTMSLMQHFNITNVYVGSGVSSWDNWKHQWNPNLFLGNPNFGLVKNFSNSYLFQFNYTDPNIVFLDDFEHAHWNEYGWQTYSYGHGLSNVTIVTNFGYDSERSLRMKARVVPTAWEWRYGQCVFREIYVQNDSDVAFSFYLNATEGFHGEDTFAAIISNIYRNQSIVIATPNSVYGSYADTISLSGFEGFFEFKGSNSVSSLWHQMFNSSLPSTFILEFLNLDFDGIENVAYVDNVEITSTPLG